MKCPYSHLAPVLLEYYYQLWIITGKDIIARWLVLDRITWHNIIVCKQMIITIK